MDIDRELLETWELDGDRTLHQALTDLANATATVLAKIDLMEQGDAPAPEVERWMAVASGLLSGIAIAADGVTDDQETVPDSVNRGLIVMARIGLEAITEDMLADIYRNLL